MTASSKHTLMSVSKSLCGLLIGRLIGQGLMAEDARIGEMVPRLKDSAFGEATIRQALDMQVSVVYDETYHDPAAQVAQQDRVAGWRPRNSDDPADTYEFLTGLQAAGRHGQRLQYCSATTDALAWAVESVTGSRYHEVLSSELWSRMAPEADAVITVDQGGFSFANGGIACTARDLAQVGQLMLDRGAVGGRQVVPESWVDSTLAGGNKAAAAGSAFQAVHPGGSYLNQWWVTGDVQGAVYGAGIHGQYLWVDPSARVVIAKFAAQPEAFSPAALVRNSEFLRWLVAGSPTR
jgi:CubicO group peptidase (beta-lactamase class C family)